MIHVGFEKPENYNEWLRVEDGNFNDKILIKRKKKKTVTTEFL